MKKRTADKDTALEITALESTADKDMAFKMSAAYESLSDLEKEWVCHANGVPFDKDEQTVTTSKKNIKKQVQSLKDRPQVTRIRDFDVINRNMARHVTCSLTSSKVHSFRIAPVITPFDLNGFDLDTSCFTAPQDKDRYAQFLYYYLVSEHRPLPAHPFIVSSGYLHGTQAGHPPDSGSGAPVQCDGATPSNSSSAATCAADSASNTATGCVLPGSDMDHLAHLPHAADTLHTAQPHLERTHSMSAQPDGEAVELLYTTYKSALNARVFCYLIIWTDDRIAILPNVAKEESNPEARALCPCRKEKKKEKGDKKKGESKPRLARCIKESKRIKRAFPSRVSSSSLHLSLGEVEQPRAVATNAVTDLSNSLNTTTSATSGATSASSAAIMPDSSMSVGSLITGRRLIQTSGHQNLNRTWRVRGVRYITDDPYSYHRTNFRVLEGDNCQLAFLRVKESGETVEFRPKMVVMVCEDLNNER